MTRALLLSALLLAGCGDKDDTGETDTTEEADTDTDTDSDSDTDTDTDADTDMGPQTCEQDADCEGVCPEGSLDCVCSETPQGDSICVPTCVTDNDCPTDELTCDEQEGICIPADGGPPQ